MVYVAKFNIIKETNEMTGEITFRSFEVLFRGRKLVDILNAVADYYQNSSGVSLVSLKQCKAEIIDC